MKVSIGKHTLGGGKKMITSLNNYRRSTHDLSYICRTTMAPGVLVPTMKLLMEPGDTFDIETRCHTLTHPTVGPLFGSFKQQNDFFFCPIRLYNAMLHNNTLNIGLNMAQVKLPVMYWNASKWKTTYIEGTNDTIYKQVHPSSLLAYLGYRSIGTKTTGETNNWQCVPVLAYYDIFKNYYANKQEENFYTVGGGNTYQPVSYLNNTPGYYLAEAKTSTLQNQVTSNNKTWVYSTIGEYQPAIVLKAIPQEETNQDLEITLQITYRTSDYRIIAQNQYQDSISNLIVNNIFTVATSTASGQGNLIILILKKKYSEADNVTILIENLINNKSRYKSYPLTDIDETREAILASGRNQFTISATNAPYIADLLINDSVGIPATASPMAGLCLKTYQSDINTNWVKTEWIDGENGINEITAIDTSSGSFTIDQLNLASKVYKMLNRIAVSDGSYNAWIQTVFTAGGLNHIETPLYLGGSSLEIEFQEVISNSATADEPLGSYAGRGVATNKKGGHIRFKADEPGYIMCITSITPRVDYYQGNEWDCYLTTLDDLHKPQLDAIGFQDRLYKYVNSSTDSTNREKSIGKQPSWIEYMTNVNKTYGNFAIAQNEGWMCLNRVFGDTDTYTTYIQPHLYNNIFAETDITAQNFWVQIGFDIKARRVMSAKQIPNL